MSAEIKTELEDGLQTPDNKYTRKDVEKLTVTQLRAKLKSMKLPVYGCKRTLCQRILMTSSDAASQVSRNTFPVFEISQQSRSASTQGSIANSKLVDLRERCKKVGLPSSGRKQELIDRLEVYYEKALLCDIDTKLEPSSLEDQPFLDWNVEPTRDSLYFEAEGGNNLFGPPLSKVHIDPYAVQDENELSKHTKQDLKAVCRRLKIKVSGKKEEVITRIWTHVSQTKSSLMLGPSESRRKRPKYCFDDIFEPFVSSGLKSRLRSNSALRPFPEIQPSVTSESLNERLHLPLSRRYFVFSTKFTDGCFHCSLQCETEENPVTVRIGQLIHCSCDEFNNPSVTCQHVLFVFLRILKISSDNSLLAKTTLLPAELDFVLRGLKQAVKSTRNAKSGIKNRMITRTVLNSEDNTVEVIRENWAGKSCGICFEPLGSNDSMVWCRVNCGKNMHRVCYEKWLEKQEAEDNKCPYCFVPWSFIPKNTRFQRKLTTNRVDWRDS